MPGPKTNEREGTRAVLRHTRTSAYKIRVVLDLIRNKSVAQARDILQFCERDAADLVLKLLNSAVANAVNNDGQTEDELFVAACYADEGRTFKTFRPRAKGRAGRIRKRSAHITVIVSRLPEEKLELVREARKAAAAKGRSRRVAGSSKKADKAVAVAAEESEEAVEAVEAEVTEEDSSASVTGDKTDVETEAEGDSSPEAEEAGKGEPAGDADEAAETTTDSAAAAEEQTDTKKDED